jgi:hypothetical protein
VDNAFFFRFNPPIALAYAALVLGLVFAYRRARDARARLAVYLLSVALVLLFLVLFAPR